MITLTLPVPPSGNRAIRHVGRMTLASREAKAYSATVARLARAAGVRPIEGDVVVDVIWYRQRKQGDVDNRAKCLLDALRHIAYHDDKQVAELRIRRHDGDRHNPRMLVTITPSGEEPA